MGQPAAPRARGAVRGGRPAEAPSATSGPSAPAISSAVAASSAGASSSAPSGSFARTQGASAVDVRTGANPALVPSPSALFTGPLFFGHPSFDDVEQGKLGDCYLLSSLSAVAKAHPEWLERIIEELPNDQIAVRFFDIASGQRVRVVVDSRLAVRGADAGRRRGWPLFARGTQPADRARMLRWGPLVEKAYAQWKGGYEAMGHGGRPSRALQEITGHPAKVVLANSGADAMRRALLDGAKRGMPMVASTLQKVHAAQLMGTGVRPNHAYAVLDVKEDDAGVLVVTLRNPWGHYEPDDDGRDGVDDGVFDLPLEKFMRWFRKVTVLDA